MLDRFKTFCFGFILLILCESLSIQGATAFGPPPQNDLMPIHEAVAAGDLDKVKEILDRDPKQIDAQVVVHVESGFSTVTRIEDMTPLAIAVGEGNVEIIKLLLDRGAHVQCGIEDGNYPLHLAAIHGNVEVARLLLEKGARVNALGCNWPWESGGDGGYPPEASALHLASSYGRVEMAKFLLEHGANVNARMKNGETPLHCAAKRGDLTLVKLLVSKGADPTIKDTMGHTPAQGVQYVAKTVPSLQKEYQSVIAFLGDVEHKPLSQEAQASLWQNVVAALTAPRSKNDSMLSVCETTPEESEFREQAKNLIKAGDIRVLKVIDTRLTDFGPFPIAWMMPEIYKLNTPQTRELAKKWLAKPLPHHDKDRANICPDYPFDAEVERHFWSSLILLKGNPSEQDLAVNSLRKLFDEIGLGTKMTPTSNDDDCPNWLPEKIDFKIEQLFSSHRKDARELACRLGNLPVPTSPVWDMHNLRAIKMLFNAGCVEGLKSLTATLRAPEIKDKFFFGDSLVYYLLEPQLISSNGHPWNLWPDWGPPGFTCESSDSVEVRKQKREQLAQWLEKKFAEIKAGKCPPLSIPPGNS
jgi:ankyrin repeat protein